MIGKKPRIAVHKFSSCDGCQLAFLNAGSQLLTLSQGVEIVHFAEAGIVAPQAQADISFVEGSIATQADVERIQALRNNTGFLVTMGACATAGGVQALRNLNDGDAWLTQIYAKRQWLDSLATSTAIADHVKVDLELWGCPVNGNQVLGAVRSLLFGVVPAEDNDKVCLQCKRQQAVCVMVTRGLPCMGPVTRTGCGALCPGFGRDCYACYGPAENINAAALGQRLTGLGLLPADVVHRFRVITATAPSFLTASEQWEKDS